MEGAGGVWTRLAAALGPPDAREHAGDARVGATLALIHEVDGDFEIVYTKRGDDLRTHPGQIALPGGRVDRGESVPQAALREASEEIGLDPETATPLGALPAGYIPPSRFWLQTVVARWDRPHALRAAEGEVAEIVRVRVSHLSQPERWRTVRLSVSGWTWAWQLDGGHLLWGATGSITSALLDRLSPGWNAGRRPDQLAPEWEVQPWRGNHYGRARAPWIPGVPVVPVSEAPSPWPDPPTLARVDAVAAAAGEAARRLEAQRVVVLAGGGGNGRAGIATARRMAQDGRQVTVVTDRALDRLPADSRVLLGDLDALELPGELPRADLYVDALVGAGIDGRLRDGALRLLGAVQRRDAPVLALDVPSGMHPDQGLVGPCVAARVSLTLGGPRPGALSPGVEPWVGDVYASDEQGGITRVRLPSPEDG